MLFLLRILRRGVFRLAVICDVFAGRAADIFAECPVKIGHIIETDPNGDVGNRSVGRIQEQFCCQTNSFGVGVIDQGIAGVPLKGSGEIRGGVNCMLMQNMHGQ